MKLIVPILFVLLAASVVVAGCTTTNNQGNADHNGANMQGDAMMENDDSAMDNPPGESMMEGYSGNVLAGTTTQYLEFNQADYEKALSEGKTILLYFYANWCPTCKAEQPRAQEAFDSLDNEDIVGFRVNYRDSQTDSDETALAKKFGITYQHTKVIINSDGERVLKSPENWDSDRYISELTNAV